MPWELPLFQIRGVVICNISDNILNYENLVNDALDAGSPAAESSRMHVQISLYSMHVGKGEIHLTEL